eukprot:Gb_18408 [translate_table: standard]
MRNQRPGCRTRCKGVARARGWKPMEEQLKVWEGVEIGGLAVGGVGVGGSVETTLGGVEVGDGAVSDGVSMGIVQDSVASAGGIGRDKGNGVETSQHDEERISQGMITEAIFGLKERTGSSQHTISKFIKEKYKADLPPNFKRLLLTQLKNLTKAPWTWEEDLGLCMGSTYNDGNSKLCRFIRFPTAPSSLAFWFTWRKIVHSHTFLALNSDEVDYLKYANYYNQDIKPELRYSIMRDGLFKTGRPIFYSLCEWGKDHPALWANKVDNSWRRIQDMKT